MIDLSDDYYAHVNVIDEDLPTDIVMEDMCHREIKKILF